ncbi:MAG: glycosyltransferase [Sphaerospermopsis sp. SIO1G1]|nr:glycosyltransferase [Sphaerospermopsis sp. SIO1G1]
MTDIAFFLIDLGGGGAEKVMLSLAAGFANKGLKVDLVLAQKTGEYLSLIPDNIRVIDLASPRLISSLPLLVKYLQQNSPKFLFSALEDPNVLSIVAQKLAGVTTRVIVTVHNHVSNYCRESRELKRKFTPWLISWLFPQAAGIVAVSQGVANEVAKISGLPSEKIRVIYNPIFTPELLPKFHESVEHPWFQDDQLPVILGIGRLTKQKDFGTLIRAFAIVEKKYPSRLMILGQGGKLAELQALVADLDLVKKVDFPGFVDNPYAYLSKAKMLVMSSIFEGFGNVLVESMMAGTPVVSTDCESGPSEILSDGKYGHLAKVGDPENLATAIIDTFSNHPVPEMLKKRGQEFSLEAALSKYEKICNEIALS